MAHTLTITSDAITDLSLTTGDLDLLDYTPQDSGEDVVTETALVSVKGSAVTDIQAYIERMKKAFELADRRYDKGHGDRVYIKFQPSGASAAYRSELVRPDTERDAGRIDYDGDVLGGRWAAKDLTVQLEWTRRNYWEANSESELSISNGGGSGTGGQTIYNIHGTAALSDTSISFAETNNRISDSNNGLGAFSSGDIISVRGSTSNDGVYSIETVAGDGSYLDINEDVLSDEAAGDSIDIYDIQNYVHIASGSIDGDLPSAVRIEVKNDSTGNALETLWAGVNNTSAPNQFPHLLEIADSDTGSNSTGDYANGFSRSYTIGTSEAKVTGWDLGSDILTSADGAYFKVYSRFAQSTGVVDVKWRLKVIYSSGTIWEGEQVQYDDTYADVNRLIRSIDSVQLPPYSPEGNTPEALTLELWGESTTGGNVSVDIDCLILIPLDHYYRLRSTATASQNQLLIDDGIQDVSYLETTTPTIIQTQRVGEHPLIDPSSNNRIYFLMHSGTNWTADHDMPGTVQVYYRARKSSI